MTDLFGKLYWCSLTFITVPASNSGHVLRLVAVLEHVILGAENVSEVETYLAIAVVETYPQLRQVFGHLMPP